jgi:hypothetical protein
VHFGVEVSDCCDAHPVSEQAVESGCRLQSVGRRSRGRQDESEVDPARGGGLDHCELLTAAKAQGALLRGDVEVADPADLAEQGVMQGPQFSSGVDVESAGRVRRCGYAGVLAFPGQQRDPVRRAGARGRGQL